jgi:anaerobic magnesium-protoporphyrin IX monomethyl ester cyclase
MAPVRNPDRPPIRDLDRYRVGWELIKDWDRYQCFGLGRAAIVQFSRGCPHRCTYCGQHGFWKSWRHRDPVKLADEIQWLHDVHGIRFITLADENPTTNPKLWKRFLQEVASRNIDVQFFTTLRAADIVRDAEFIDLYRKAGILYVLLGIDATDPELIQTIRKRSTTTIDGQACALLRKAGIRSIIAHIVGLGEDSWTSFWRAFRTLCRYDGDLLNVMYATPHTWTQFARDSADRLVAQEDQSCWDYRHQVMHEKSLRPWQLFLAVKALELAFHLRPRILWRMLANGGWRMRWQRLWTQLHITMVWWGEVCEYIFKTRFARKPKPLRNWMGPTEHTCEDAGAPPPPSRVPIHVRGRELTVTAR